MGIKGLAEVINGGFYRGWSRLCDLSAKERQHLVIGGSNICCRLYQESGVSSWLGGEYGRYRDFVKEQFGKLHTQFGKLLVVSDGSRPELIKDAVFERRETALAGMCDTQHGKKWDSSVRDYGTPHFVVAVFMEVMRSLEYVEIVVTNDEANCAIAALANHCQCPVLASDSDFFILELQHGFIQLNDWFDEKNACKVRIFSMHELKFKDSEGSFSLPEHNQCLLIPAVFGNDVMKPLRDKPKHLRSFQGVFREAFKYGTREFLSRCSTELCDNFKNAKEFYKLPRFYDICFSASADQLLAKLPEWVIECRREGKLIPFLLDAYCEEPCLLPKTVEAIEKESAWRISRSIRQHMCGIMGLTRVEEWIRKDGFVELCAEQIPPLHLPSPISIDSIEGCSVKKLEELMLQVLSFPRELDKLEGKWKLPIAATFFWYQHKSTPRDLRENLLKCLLLSFLTCSGVISNDVPSLPPVNAKTKGRHLTALHCFAQWQCVYYDARALNYLAREPFPTTSPASLYSGKVAMHYATDVAHEYGWDWLRLCTATRISPRGLELIGMFWRLVTGSDINFESQ